MRSKLIALTTGIMLASSVAAFAQGGNTGTVDSTTANPTTGGGVPVVPGTPHQDQTSSTPSRRTHSSDENATANGTSNTTKPGVMSNGTSGATSSPMSGQ